MKMSVLDDKDDACQRVPPRLCVPRCSGYCIGVFEKGTWKSDKMEPYWALPARPLLSWRQARPPLSFHFLGETTRETKQHQHQPWQPIPPPTVGAAAISPHSQRRRQQRWRKFPFFSIYHQFLWAAAMRAAFQMPQKIITTTAMVILVAIQLPQSATMDLLLTFLKVHLD